MPNKYVTSGAMLGFKTGLQSTIDTMLSRGAEAGAAHGAFYLAQDTHRLYVGNEDTSLSPVNEGIVTVASINDLPDYRNYSADQRKLLAGQFYYISGVNNSAESNILCVFNGQRWVQINQMPEIATISTYEFEVETADNNTDKVIKGTIEDSLFNSASGRFQVKGDNGVVVTYGSASVTIDGVAKTVPAITVSADYTLSAVKDATTSVVGLKLGSEDASNDSTVNFVAGEDGAGNTNVSFDVVEGKVQITSKDTKNQSVAVTGNETAGFDVTIKDNFLGSVSTNFQPKITYGATPVTVDFVGGTATLSAYTKSEVDSLITTLNAMTYIGKYNTPSSGQGTGADTINPTTGVVSKDGQEVPMHVGDTLLVDYTVNLPAALSSTGAVVQMTPGSLMIARGTEVNGVIDPSTLKFDVVVDTHTVDTTYIFAETTDGIALKDSDLNTTGTLLFTGGNDAVGNTTDDMIKVTKSYTAVTGNSDGAKNATITIKHKDVARTNSTATAVNQAVAAPTNSWQGETSVTVVTGITTNTSGHITGVETTQVNLRDTVTTFPATGGFTVTTAAHAGTNNKTVGVFTNTITMVTPGLEQTTATSYSAITSKTLVISDDDTQKITSDSNQTASGLNIEMVWGSF